MIDADVRDEVRKEVRTHLTIATSVLFLLALAVAVSYMDMELRHAVVIVLSIAGVQAFLIAAFLMHGAGERRTIHALIAVTVIFLGALMVLTAVAHHDGYEGATQSPQNLAGVVGDESAEEH
jgi:caa(3)-type oxidase subunit IV